MMPPKKTAPDTVEKEPRQGKPLDLDSGVEKSDVDASLGYLLNKDNALLTTEIDNPLAMTVLEVFADDLREDIHEVSEVLDDLVVKFKLNMIPYKRKRAAEAIQITDAASGRKADRERSRLRQALLGGLE